MQRVLLMVLVVLQGLRTGEGGSCDGRDVKVTVGSTILNGVRVEGESWVDAGALRLLEVPKPLREQEVHVPAAFPVPEGAEVALECCAGDEGCTFVVSVYHCPPCSKEVDGGLQGLLTLAAEGTSVRCAPRFGGGSGTMRSVVVHLQAGEKRVVTTVKPTAAVAVFTTAGRLHKGWCPPAQSPEMWKGPLVPPVCQLCLAPTQSPPTPAPSTGSPPTPSPLTPSPPTASPPTPVPTLVPVAPPVDGTASSRCRELRDRKLDALTGYRVDCPAGKVLQGWKLDYCGEKEMKFSTTCWDVRGGLGKCRTRATDCDDMHGKPLQYLDRHAPRCASNKEAMTSWSIEKGSCSGGKLRIRYTCCEVDSGYSRTMTMTTSCQPAKGKNVEFLDRHSVRCGDDMVLEGFTFSPQECARSGEFQFRYQCRYVRSPAVPNADYDYSSTGCQDTHDRPLHFLDRHNVDCDTAKEVILGWQMVDHHCSDDDNRQFKTQCSHVTELGRCYNRFTRCNGMVDTDLEFLDRHAPSCKEGEALKKWKVVDGCQGKDRRIRYTCCEVDGWYGNSINVETECDVARGKPIQYLDRHRPSCGSGMVMQKFRFTSEGCTDRKHFHFKYSCRYPGSDSISP